ncbi:hypothetical protein JRQ81_008989 [Phrynocephalus forsythii]|uniref:Cytochrome c oxidase assembly protein COX20, mitochondrial n=1 Tax=Phrynocephalus forsythii TaxID=171643 RepID=A0A9Q0Y502_9SAUR|nr:hypothetical protein JRQ81_008989 [Phrynocephalus forsythii]
MARAAASGLRPLCAAEVPVSVVEVCARGGGRLGSRTGVIMEPGEDHPEKSFKILGIDIGRIPCAPESFLYGALGGVAIGLGHFLVTSRARRSYYVAIGGFSLTTTGFWFYCRYNHAKRRFERRMIQEGIKNMLLYEGTQYDATKRAATNEEKRV